METSTSSLLTNKAQYILRYYLPVEPMADAETTQRRFAELLDYCRENHVGAVMFYVSLHPNWYYMPDSLEHTRYQAEVMKPLIPQLRAKGISYQLNYQNLMGSIAGGADFYREFGWKTLVDHKGHATTGAACPLDSTFRDIMGQQLRLWAETEPDVIWIDDDFRMHNHGGLLGNGKPGEGTYMDWYCYCDEHLKRFAEKVGRSYTREELLKAAFAPGKPSEVRKQWLEFLDETMAETAAWVYDCVHSVSPKTRLAQMTSVPDVHSAEGRHWGHFLNALCGEHPAVIRPHFGPYSETSPYEFASSYCLVDQLQANVAAQYGDAVYGPEIENTRYTVWSKSVAATRYQMWLSVLMGHPNITLAISDLEGSPLEEEPAYGALLRDEKASLDALAALELGNWDRQGVILITDPCNGVKVELDTQGEGPDTISGRDRTFDSIFTQLGIPVRYMTPEEALTREDLIAVDSYTVQAFSREQLRVLLGKNCLFDGAAARLLTAKGFGSDLGIASVEESAWLNSGEIFHGIPYADGNPKRMPCRIPSGHWMKLTLTPNARPQTTLVACNGQQFPGLTKTENALGGCVWVYPGFGSFERGFFNHARGEMLRRVVMEACASTPMAIPNRAGLCLARRAGEELLLAFAPLSPDGVESLPVYVGQKAARCELFRSGRFEELDAVVSEAGELTVPQSFRQYEWAVLRFRIK